MSIHPLFEFAVTNALLASFLAIVVWTLTSIVRNPHVAHVLWCVVLLKLVTPPLTSIPIGMPADQNETASTPVAATRVEPIEHFYIPPVDAEIKDVAPSILNDVENAPAPIIETPSPTVEPVARSEPVFMPDHSTSSDPAAFNWQHVFARLPVALVSIWLMGSGVVALMILSRTLAFGRQLRRMTAMDEGLDAAAERVAGRVGLARLPAVRLVSAPVGPLVWAGGRKPLVIVPDELWAALGGVERETLLAHEFAHLVRRDHWVRRGEVLLIVLYWWLPTLWWAIRRREAAAEACCDALVLRNFPEQPAAYAEALLHALELSSARSPVLLSQGLGRTTHLKARLTMIVQNHAPGKLGWFAWLLLIGLSVGLLGVSAEIVRAQPEEGEDTTTQSEAAEDEPAPTAVAAPATAGAAAYFDDGMTQESDSQLAWQPFSTERVKELISERKTVLVEFTADWSANCKINEKFALNTEETKAMVEDHGIVALMADFTNESAEIQQWLDRFNAVGIPLTVIFPAGNPNEPIILDGLYSQSTLIESLEQAVDGSSGNNSEPAPTDEAAEEEPKAGTRPAAGSATAPASAAPGIDGTSGTVPTGAAAPAAADGAGMMPSGASSNISPEVRQKMLERLLAIALNEKEPLKVRLSAIDAVTSAGIRIESTKGGDRLEAAMWTALSKEEDVDIQRQIIEVLAKLNSVPPTVEAVRRLNTLLIRSLGPHNNGPFSGGDPQDARTIVVMLNNLSASDSGLSRLVESIESTAATQDATGEMGMAEMEGGGMMGEDMTSAAGMGDMGMYSMGMMPAGVIKLSGIHITISDPRANLLSVLANATPRDDKSVNVLLKTLENEAADIRAAAISALGNLKTSRGRGAAGMMPGGAGMSPERE